MKREFLEALEIEGGKLPREVIDQIMAENGRDIEGHKNSIARLTTERDGLREQLEAANGQIKSYKDMDIDGIKQAAADWESKYNTDTQALQQQLDDANYGFAVKEAIAELKFSSESAKKAFTAELTAKKLPLQEGKLLGLEDFTKGYQESDPMAFVSEDPDSQPTFVKGGTGGGGGFGNRLDASLRAAMGLPPLEK